MPRPREGERVLDTVLTVRMERWERQALKALAAKRGQTQGSLARAGVRSVLQAALAEPACETNPRTA